jgi:hypothetical protein
MVEETPGSRKKRLKAQSKASRAANKQSTKPAQQASAAEVGRLTSTGDTTINRMAELGLPIPETDKPATVKNTVKKTVKKASKPKAEEPAAPIVPITSDRGAEGSSEKNEEFIKAREEKDLGEIGESSVKYEGQLAEIPSGGTVPKNKGIIEEDPLRPKPKYDLVPPTPSQEALRTADVGIPLGTGGTRVFSANTPSKPHKPKRDIAELRAERKAKGLPGLPGDESGINNIAVELAKQDWKKAKESGKPVNDIHPEDEEPTIDDVYYGHHRRLAILMRGGITADQIANSAKGKRQTFVQKTKYLHDLLEKSVKAGLQDRIDLKAEGITHWVHPKTGVAHAISENHPDMPKTIDPNSGTPIHGFTSAAGTIDRVRRDPNTQSWVLDKKTGNREIDDTLGYDPDKPEGWNVVNLRGGIRALKQNVIPSDRRTVFEHEVDQMQSEFPASVSTDSRLMHKTAATKIVRANDSRVRDLGRNKPVPKSAVVQSRQISTGRTTPAGFTVSGEGEAEPTTVPLASRARNVRANTIGTYDRSYNPGGSVRITDSSVVPEVAEVQDVIEGNQPTADTTVNGRPANITSDGRAGTIPYRRGVVLEQRNKAVLPRSKQLGGTGLSSWVPEDKPKYEPRILPINEPGVSTAEPITKKDATSYRVLRTEAPMPKSQYKGKKKSGKTVTQVNTIKTQGMYDQMLPGMQPEGPATIKGEKPEALPFFEQPVKEDSGIVPPTLLSPSQSSAKAVREASLSHLLAKSGTEGFDVEETRSAYEEAKKKHLETFEIPHDYTQPEQSKEIVKILGNTPVEGEPTKLTGKKVYSYKKGKTEIVPPKPKTPKKAKKEIKEQLELPGMETPGSAHAQGAQWLRSRQMNKATLELQRKAKNAGVPGGANPVQIARGTEAKKPTGSNKGRS